MGSCWLIAYTQLTMLCHAIIAAPTIPTIYLYPNQGCGEDYKFPPAISNGFLTMAKVDKDKNDTMCIKKIAAPQGFSLSLRFRMINMPSCDDRFTLLDGKTQVELFTSFPHFCGRKVEPPSPVEIQDAMQAVTVSYLSSAHPGSVWIELAVHEISGSPIWPIWTSTSTSSTMITSPAVSVPPLCLTPDVSSTCIAKIEECEDSALIRQMCPKTCGLCLDYEWKTKVSLTSKAPSITHFPIARPSAQAHRRELSTKVLTVGTTHDETTIALVSDKSPPREMATSDLHNTHSVIPTPHTPMLQSHSLKSRRNKTASTVTFAQTKMDYPTTVSELNRTRSVTTIGPEYNQTLQVHSTVSSAYDSNEDVTTTRLTSTADSVYDTTQSTATATVPSVTASNTNRTTKDETMSPLTSSGVLTYNTTQSIVTATVPSFSAPISNRCECYYGFISKDGRLDKTVDIQKIFVTFSAENSPYFHPRLLCNDACRSEAQRYRKNKLNVRIYDEIDETLGDRLCHEVNENMNKRLAIISRSPQSTKYRLAYNMTKNFCCTGKKGLYFNVPCSSVNGDVFG